MRRRSMRPKRRIQRRHPRGKSRRTSHPSMWIRLGRSSMRINLKISNQI